MLEYQERLKSRKGRSNAESTLRVSKIPCGNQIMRLLNVIDGKAFVSVFSQGLKRRNGTKDLTNTWCLATSTALSCCRNFNLVVKPDTCYSIGASMRES